MEMMTVKRNGVFISFPVMDHNPIKGEEVNSDIENNGRVEGNVKQKVNAPIIKKYINLGYVKRLQPKVADIKGKKCSRCGESGVYMDSQYCWDCYKYEHYESR